MLCYDARPAEERANKEDKMNFIHDEHVCTIVQAAIYDFR